MATDFRKQIIDRLKKIEKTRYWLADQLDGDPSSNAIYRYLHPNPKKPTDMKASHVAKILDILEAEERKRLR